MDTILEARDLTKQYEGFNLADVSMEVRRGAIAGIFGPNGAGKSTLVKILAHQVSARSGFVRIFNLTYTERETEIKNRVGYVAQEPAFYRDKTVRWTARFAAPYFARWDGATFYSLLDEFKVNSLKKIAHLSGGQRKLLAIAFALSHGAEILILDEPAAGLDAVHRRALLDRLRAFVADGEKSVVVASHVTDGLDEIVDDVHILHEGRLVMHEERDDLLSRWKWIHFREGTLDPAILGRLSDLRREAFGDSGLTREFPALREALSAALVVGDAKVENARLEDVLVSLVKET
jgi:ABC-2 type transport system ATP-binding protein